MNKQLILEIFEDLLQSFEMSQSSVIASGAVEDHEYDELEEEVNEYRREFEEALNN